MKKQEYDVTLHRKSTDSWLWIRMSLTFFNELTQEDLPNSGICEILDAHVRHQFPGWGLNSFKKAAGDMDNTLRRPNP